MSQPPWRERQRQLREEAILDAACELLARQGYAEMSMDELAQQVGVAKATLYQHFDSKEELAIKVIGRILQRSEEDIDALDPTLPAIRRLEQTLRRGFARRAGLWPAKLTLMPGSVQAHPRYQAYYQRLTAKVAALVDQAKAEGDVPPELSTPVIVRLWSSLFRTDYGDLLTSGQCTTEELAETLITVFFHGLRRSRA